MGRGRGESDTDLSGPSVARRGGAVEDSAKVVRSVAMAKLAERLRAAAESSPVRSDYLLGFAGQASDGTLTGEDVRYAISSLGSPSEPALGVPLAMLPDPPSREAVDVEAIAIGFGLSSTHDRLVADHERRVAGLRLILDGDEDAEAEYPELAWYKVDAEYLDSVKRAAFGRNVDPDAMDRDYSHQAILELDDGTIEIVEAKHSYDIEHLENYVENVVDHRRWHTEQKTRALALQALAQETLDRWVSESRPA